MIPQPPRVIWRRYERVPERVAFHQGRHVTCVTEVVCVGPLGQGWTRSRLHGDHTELLLCLCPEFLADEREAHACEVGSAACAAHQHVGVISCHLHLLDGLLTDDGLVHQNVVQDRPQSIFCWHLALDTAFHCLRNRDPERACAFGVFFENLLANFGPVRGRRIAICPKGLHVDAAVRLGLERHLDLKNLHIKTEACTRVGERATPLACASLCGQLFGSSHLVIVSLWDSCVWLMASCG